MMEHVRIFDWCQSVHDRYFVDEADLDNCTTEKILRNRFIDPLVSSDSEDDDRRNKIDWDEIFKDKTVIKGKLFVPGLRPVPPYPRISELTARQHTQFLKILSDENHTILKELFLGKPSRMDYKAFEDAKELYQKEQKAYIDWAKSLWASDHCIRALRPKPAVERVYEAEFKVKAQRIKALPKYYDIAAQIMLENRRSNSDAVLKKEIISVTLAEMPQVQIPVEIDKQISIIRPCTVPEPCQKHPYQIVLPNEDALSMLPITEIHRELATFALNNGADYIASENAVKCLTQWNRHWLLPISVCDTIGPDGTHTNVVVLDSEFSVQKEVATIRTYKAFRHLLEHALIPSAERESIWSISKNRSNKKEIVSPKPVTRKSFIETMDVSSDEESNNLFIDMEEDDIVMSPGKKSKRAKTEESPRRQRRMSGERPHTRAQHSQDIGVYSCTCKDTLYEKPPHRSFKRWQFKNKNPSENCDIIIHCPHKAKDKSGELILEPHPEYQLDLGASELSPDTQRSIALSLALRKHASVLICRVDGGTGDMVTVDKLSCAEWSARHPQRAQQALGAAHSALAHLRDLRPGRYVLLHEASHGANAMLMSVRPGAARHSLSLSCDSSAPDLDEARMVKLPPTISTALLPYHKQRRTLPCAFTPYENMIVKEPKKPPPKKKAPPQAIKWPKKRGRPRKKY